ncbi:MAG: DUF5615 family PIN-like protein [candidate division KSB1 bacterium]|nr:DUF5615 family PIN-like protein [candidate division KSB1 bacterium]MDZ7365886.1 DUF5615 family PIN-like protein [candidate division KSB1 bacterium]MDZ7403879.1 DUF5615 family PIN-like protein [candidate division KSB1 bacterium]
MKIKLYLNENLSDEIAKRLRADGIDAVSSHESGMDTQDDYAQMQFAVSHERAIVSINKKDFIRLHLEYIKNGKEHWGVILSNDIDHSVIYRRLLRLVGMLQAEDTKNQLIRLHEFRR